MPQRLFLNRSLPAAAVGLWLLGAPAGAQTADTRNADVEQDRAALIELVDRLKQENEQLRAALSQQDKMAAELKKTHDQATELRSQLDRQRSLQQEADRRAVEIVQQMAERDRSIAGLERRLAERDAEFAALNEQLAELRRSREEQQQNALQMIQMLDQRDRSVVGLERRLAERDAEFAALNEQLAELRRSQNEIADERDRAIASAQRHRQMLNTARARSRALQDEMNDKLSAQDTDYQHRLGELQGHVSTLGGKLREARNERDSVRAELQAALGRISELSNKAYTVRAGDSLSKIAQEFYGDPLLWQPIFEANRDTLKNPSSLATGMELVIPPR